MTETPANERHALLDYVPDELAEIQRLRRVEQEAKARIPEIDKKIHEAELEFYRRKDLAKARPDRTRVLAEAALSGAKPPPEPPPPPPTSDLEATIQGLRAIRKEAETQAEACHGAVRSGTIAAYRAAAERCAADYLASAKRTAELHANIGGANGLLRSFGIILVGEDWGDLTIPSSELLPALKGKDTDCYFRRVLAGGDREPNGRAARSAQDAAKRHVVGLLGEWPFDRT